MHIKGGGWCHRKGQRVKVNFLSPNENNGSGILIFDNERTIPFWENLHFLGKKTFSFSFCFFAYWFGGGGGVSNPKVLYII